MLYFQALLASVFFILAAVEAYRGGRLAGYYIGVSILFQLQMTQWATP